MGQDDRVAPRTVTADERPLDAVTGFLRRVRGAIPAVGRFLVRDGGDLLGRVFAARSRYGAGTIPLLRRGLELTWERGFDPGEAFALGLFDPDVSSEGLEACASKAETMALQRALNPPAWSGLISNKHLFHRHCTAGDVPVPELLAVFLTGSTGWTAGGRALAGRSDWSRYFDRRAPDHFVIKPVSGYHGESVMVIHRVDGRFSVGGRRFTSGELFDEMRGDRFDEFLVQERLWNHPSLTELGGTEALQTARVTSVVDGDGRIRIIQALLKLVAAGGSIDNYLGGTSGNLLAGIDPETGVLGPAATVEPGEAGIRRVSRHPETGAELEGTPLPCWDDVRSLVRRAAAHFLPIRTIGWDVAMTPDGPVVVEGNVWWDPPNPLGSMAPVISALEGLIASEARASGGGDGAGQGREGGSRVDR